MVAGAAIIVTVIVVLGIVIPLLLRSWGAEQARIEAHMHDPHTRTVAFAIPNGVDPVTLSLAVHHAGFPSVVDRVGDAECLLVECGEAERSRLRSVIEAVHLGDYDGTEIPMGHVVFEDER